MSIEDRAELVTPSAPSTSISSVLTNENRQSAIRKPILGVSREVEVDGDYLAADVKVPVELPVPERLEEK